MSRKKKEKVGYERDQLEELIVSSCCCENYTEIKLAQLLARVIDKLDIDEDTQHELIMGP